MARCELSLLGCLAGVIVITTCGIIVTHFLDAAKQVALPNRLTDEWTDGRMDMRTDERTAGRTDEHSVRRTRGRTLGHTIWPGGQRTGGRPGESKKLLGQLVSELYQ
jgi:hypothetical protein